MNESFATALDAVRRGGRWFFGVPFRGRTYRNLCYLLLAFPLGLAYFVFLVTSVTISAVLTILLIGIPLLGFTLFAVVELAAFERFLAERLLGIDVPTSNPSEDAREWLWRLVFDRSPWLGGVYLLSKFFLGVATFVALVFGLTITYSLLSAPFHYREETVGIHVADPIEFIPAISYQHDGWTLDLVSPITIAIADGELISIYVDSVPAALAVSAVGVLAGIVTLHLFNALAWLYGRYTALFLRRTRRSSIGHFVIWADDGAGGDGGSGGPPGPGDGSGSARVEGETGRVRDDGGSKRARSEDESKRARSEDEPEPVHGDAEGASLTGDDSGSTEGGPE